MLNHWQGDTTNYDSDSTDRNYDPSENSSNTYDPPPNTPDDNSPYDDFISDLDDENDSITLNPDRVDHHDPITGVEPNHDYNLCENEEPPAVEPTETEMNPEPPEAETPEADLEEEP